MMIVSFEYKTVEGSNKVWYPDDIELFSNSRVVDGVHYAEYTGSLPLAPASNEPQKPGVSKMSTLAFIDLLGDDIMIRLLNVAKTDSVVDLMMIKLNNAEFVDFEDQARGPQKGLQYLLSKEYISQEEYDRVMRREFL